MMTKSKNIVIMLAVMVLTASLVMGAEGDVSINPSSVQVAPGDSITLTVRGHPPEGTAGTKIIVSFDPSLLEATAWTSEWGGGVGTGGRIDNTAGMVDIRDATFTNLIGGSEIDLATVTFTAPSLGTSNIDLTTVEFGTEAATGTLSGAEVIIQTATPPPVCTPGTTRCSPDGEGFIETCVADGSGWGQTAHCPTQGKQCSNGQCVSVQTAQCGNGVVEGTEACDSAAFAGKTCASVMGAGSTGELICNHDCTLITEGCSVSPQGKAQQFVQKVQDEFAADTTLENNDPPVGFFTRLMAIILEVWQ